MKVSDVADVALLEAKATSETRANDQQAVLMSVLQESGANTATVSTAFKDALDQMLAQEEYKGVEADIMFDQGDYVKLAVGNIGQTLLLGGLFAMIVLFLFLRGIKSPIIIGISIPYSVIVTFVLMFFADFSLNIMTLGALALGIGMLVDNSIIVIENIERHIAMGKGRTEAARDGTKEISGAITASTLTTLAVFVPVIFISGLIGQIFTEFALTISFSLFASLVVALTVVPMMASRMLTKPRKNIEARRRRSKSLNSFERSVKWSLRHRAVVLLLTLVLLVGSGFGLLRVGTEFLPPTDEGFFSISIKMPNGSSLSSTNEIVKKIESKLKEERDIDVYVSLIGGTQQSMAQGGSKSDRAEMYVKLVPLSERNRSVFEFVDDVQPEVLELVGQDATVRFDMQTAAGSSPNTLSFTLKDTDEQRLDESVAKIDEELRKLDSVLEVSNNLQDTVEEIHIDVNREKASDLGLAPYQIAQTVNSITRGQFASQFVDKKENVVSVIVQYDERYRDSIEKLKQIKLRTPSGNFVTLG